MREATITITLPIERMAELGRFLVGKEVVVDNLEVDPIPETESEQEKKITLTELRAAATKITKEGKRTALPALFKKYGADKLSGVKEEDYAALLEDIENA